MLKEKLLETFKNLGGIEKYINKGETILLKVNLVMRKKPEEAATTHPAFVRALSEILVNYGCKVIIGDSPGGPFNALLLKSIYKTTGMEEAAKLSGASLNYSTETLTAEYPEGKIIRKLTVAKFIMEADKIISVSKLKTHSMTKMTGAVKNMFGIIPGTVKAEYHFSYPDVDAFSDCLLDICGYASPILSFMDGITAMEGHGPTAGTPRKVGVILACENPYELDLAASKIINSPINETPLIRHAIERGLCSKNTDEIKTVGDNLNYFVQKNFILPKTGSMHFLGDNPPKFLEGFVKKNLQPKPVFNSKLCVGCGDCALNCPAKIIEIKERLPHADLDKCIRCFCCQELCPMKAVSIKRPLILKMLSKF